MNVKQKLQSQFSKILLKKRISEVHKNKYFVGEEIRELCMEIENLIPPIKWTILKKKRCDETYQKVFTIITKEKQIKKFEKLINKFINLPTLKCCIKVQNSNI